MSDQNIATTEAAPAEKPKRQATTGTRKGNGAGWGGPAKGAGEVIATAPKFKDGNQAAAGRGRSEFA